MPNPPPTSIPGGPGSYTGGTNAQGYGGAGEIMGGNQVPYSGINLPYFQQDRDRLGGLLNGQSPFAGQDWGSLIKQLQMRANGQGPSLAEQTYRGAQQDNVAAQAAMSRGSSSPAAAYAAMQNQQRTGQGMAAGVTQARTQEQFGAQQSLQQAMGQRDQLNQGAYLSILGSQLGLSDQQLKALMGDQSFSIQQGQLKNQQQANQYAAISGLLGAGAKLGS